MGEPNDSSGTSGAYAVNRRCRDSDIASARLEGGRTIELRTSRRGHHRPQAPEAINLIKHDERLVLQVAPLGEHDELIVGFVLGRLAGGRLRSVAS